MRNFSCLTKLFFVGMTGLLFTANAFAGKVVTPVISIIIDDIGYRMHEDLRAVALPGPVAFAIMPYSPHAQKISELAVARGKVVLLHLPMQAVEEDKNKFLGPGGLTLQMTHNEFIRSLDNSLRAVPLATGVNNHMGSLLTRHPGNMSWLMQSLKNHHKFYIDSVTSRHSVAAKIARETRLPYLQRDVFLDDAESNRSINEQFDELVSIAKRKGMALAIGHPHPDTLTILSEKLLQLDTYGVRMISLKDMLTRKYSQYETERVSLNR